MAKPSPVLRKVGSSISSMYHPKLLRKCAIMMAQTGMDVKTFLQGTGGEGPCV